MDDNSIWRLAKRVEQFIDEGLIDLAKKDLNDIKLQLDDSVDNDLIKYVNEINIKIYGVGLNKGEEVKNPLAEKYASPVNKSQLEDILTEIGKDLKTIKSILLFFFALSLLSLMVYFISWISMG